MALISWFGTSQYLVSFTINCMPEAPKVDSFTVDRLYREYHRWLFNWLIKKLNCPHHAADIAHDTCARVMVLPQTLNPDFPLARASNGSH